MKYLSKRNGYYWLRISPRKALLPYLPIRTKEYLLSLGDVSQAQAERKAHPILAEWLSEIAKAERQLELAKTDLGDKDIAELVSSFDNRPPSDAEFDSMQDWVYKNASGVPYDKIGDEVTRSWSTLGGEGIGVYSYFYLDEYEKSLIGLKAKTIQQRISRIKEQFIKRFDYLDDKTLTRVKIQRWVDSYVTIDNPPAYKTLKGYINDCRGYVTWLIQKGYLEIHDPFTSVKLPRTKALPSEEREAFSDEDLYMILKAIEDKDLKELTLIAMYTGLRIEEIAKLKPINVKTVGERFTVAIAEAKTKAGIRVIPINKSIQSIIAERINNKDYLFPKGSDNANGTRSDLYSKRFTRVKRKLGFGSTKVFHSIRKTVATKLEQAGVPIGVASDILGHDKANMSYGLYSEGSSMESKEEALNKIRYAQTG
jgi:integrase